MAVKLSLTGITRIGDRYGLHALAPLLEESTREQFVILRVVPVEETRTRGEIEPTTKVQVTAIEAVVDPGEIGTIATFMESLTRRRFRRRPQGEQPAMNLDPDDSPDEPEHGDQGGDQGGGDYVRPAGEDPDFPGELESDQPLQPLQPGDVVVGASGAEYEILEQIHPPATEPDGDFVL